MKIVQYFEKNGNKVFDVAQALEDSGWGITLENLLETKDLLLMDRTNNNMVTISSITYDGFMNMFFVSYIEGGWQCLDHAIEQFGPALKRNQMAKRKTAEELYAIESACREYVEIIWQLQIGQIEAEWGEAARRQWHDKLLKLTGLSVFEFGGIPAWYEIDDVSQVSLRLYHALLGQMGHNE